MSKMFQFDERLPALVDKVVASYDREERTRHIDQIYLPSRAEAVEIIQLLLELAYPGYHGRQGLTRHNVQFHVGELLPKLGEKLSHRSIRPCAIRPRRTAKTRRRVDAHAKIGRYRSRWSFWIVSRRSGTGWRATSRRHTTETRPR
jgi:hypothetical protein